MVAGPRVLTDGRPAPPPSVVPCPPVGHLRVGADRSAAAGVRTLLGHLAARRRGPREFLHTSSPRPLRRLRLRRPRRDRGVRVGRDRAAVGGPPSPHRRSLGAGRILAHRDRRDRKSTRLNSSHLVISYAVFCLKKKKKNTAIR